MEISKKNIGRERLEIFFFTNKKTKNQNTKTSIHRNKIKASYREKKMKKVL